MLRDMYDIAEGLVVLAGEGAVIALRVLVVLLAIFGPLYAAEWLSEWVMGNTLPPTMQ